MLLGDTAHGTPAALEFIRPALTDPEARTQVGAVGFHTWRGCTEDAMRQWSGAARELGVPLLVTESGPDAYLTGRSPSPATSGCTAGLRRGFLRLDTPGRGESMNREFVHGAPMKPLLECVLGLPPRSSPEAGGILAGDGARAAKRHRRCLPVQTGCLLLLLVFGGASCLSTPHGPAAGGEPTRDFTLFVCSDIHVGAENLKAQPPFTKADTLARLESDLQTMRGLVGQPWPEEPGLAELNLGAIDAPRALILLGDVTDGHKDPAEEEEQRRTFEDLFPVEGVPLDGGRVPVFAGAGNHDGAPDGPVRRALVARNRRLDEAGHFAALSTNGVHFALNWSGVHFLCLNLCPADTTDAATPFKYGRPGPGSWNDPQGALTFLKDYLVRHVGASGEPVVLMHHYGFDGFSLSDWNWWTPEQRRALYELLEGYNVAAFLHGHNHHAEHYQWPDPERHAADLDYFFEGRPPAAPRRYDVLSGGRVCWVIRVRGDHLVAAHHQGAGWNSGRTGVLVRSLKPGTAIP